MVKPQSVSIDSYVQEQEILEFVKMVTIFLCMCAYTITKNIIKNFSLLLLSYL